MPLARSNSLRAAGSDSETAAPIPTVCAPCPGNRNAVLVTAYHSRRKLFIRSDNRPAHVMPTIGASDMRRHGRATFGARLQLLGTQAVVRTALTGARIGMFTFGYSHG